MLFRVITESRRRCSWACRWWWARMASTPFSTRNSTTTRRRRSRRPPRRCMTFWSRWPSECRSRHDENNCRRISTRSSFRRQNYRFFSSAKSVVIFSADGKISVCKWCVCLSACVRRIAIKGSYLLIQVNEHICTCHCKTKKWQGAAVTFSARRNCPSHWRSRTFGRLGRLSNLPPFRLRISKLESCLKLRSPARNWRTTNKVESETQPKTNPML